MRSKPPGTSIRIFVAAFLVAACLGCTSGHYFFHEGVEWVKLVKADSGGPWDHPRLISPETMQGMLHSIRYSKKVIFLKNIEHASLLTDEAVDRFAPYLAMALSQATPGQEVAFSVIVDDPKLVIFRNDRLTSGHAFVKGNELVVSFEKLNAKLIGDYANVGKEARAVQQAQSIRTALELGPGQKGIYGDPDTILFDLTYPWTGEQSGTSKGAMARSGAAPQPVAIFKPKETPQVYQQHPKTRLKQLDQLREDELITEEEYQKKRAQILEGL